MLSRTLTVSTQVMLVMIIHDKARHQTDLLKWLIQWGNAATTLQGQTVLACKRKQTSMSAILKLCISDECYEVMHLKDNTIILKRMNKLEIFNIMQTQALMEFDNSVINKILYILYIHTCKHLLQEHITQQHLTRKMNVDIPSTHVMIYIVSGC